MINSLINKDKFLSLNVLSLNEPQKNLSKESIDLLKTTIENSYQDHIKAIQSSLSQVRDPILRTVIESIFILQQEQIKDCQLYILSQNIHIQSLEMSIHEDSKKQHDDFLKLQNDNNQFKETIQIEVQSYKKELKSNNTFISTIPNKIKYTLEDNFESMLAKSPLITRMQEYLKQYDEKNNNIYKFSAYIGLETGVISKNSKFVKDDSCYKDSSYFEQMKNYCSSSIPKPKKIDITERQNFLLSVIPSDAFVKLPFINNEMKKKYNISFGSSKKFDKDFSLVLLNKDIHDLEHQKSVYIKYKYPTKGKGRYNPLLVKKINPKN